MHCSQETMKTLKCQDFTEEDFVIKNWFSINFLSLSGFFKALFHVVFIAM